MTSSANQEIFSLPGIDGTPHLIIGEITSPWIGGYARMRVPSGILYPRGLSGLVDREHRITAGSAVQYPATLHADPLLRFCDPPDH